MFDFEECVEENKHHIWGSFLLQESETHVSTMFQKTES